MKTIFKVTFSLFAIFALSIISFAQNASLGRGNVVEPFGQVNFSRGDTMTRTITQSVNPDSILDYGSIACRNPNNNYTAENHYWRSFVLSEFGITSDFNVTLVDIGIQQALAGSGLQPLTCNLYITDGTPFPDGYPNSLILIGTATLDVPDQAVSHFPIPVTGTAPAGSELVVEILIPNGQLEGNIFFIGINHFGETAQSYFSSPGCDYPIPVPPPILPDQHYVMSVTGDLILPVELTSFTAKVNIEGNVILNWATATEINNQMFEIERKNINGQYYTIGYVDGFGTTTEPQNYSYLDDISGMDVTSLSYRLKQIDFDGSYSFSEEVLVSNLAPNGFVLEQNYPNPFNPSTKIKYSIPQTSEVQIKVYDVLGNEIETLVNEEKSVGTYEVEFNSHSGNVRNLTSGIYFYKLKAGSFIETKKMILLK